MHLLHNMFLLIQTDQFESGGTCYVKDASPNGMDGLANGGGSALNIIDLETPIAIK